MRKVMFGYVICNKETLEEQEKERYQNIYCGLCKTLGKRYGMMERMSLSFDMTFLALFLTALYEPEEINHKFTCGVHPIHKKTGIWDPYIDYAADMTVAMAYHKCQDDWEDERKLIKKKYGDILGKSYKKVQEKYPRQCKAIEKSLQELRVIEKDGKSQADEAVNCSGRMLAEIFVYKEDFWSNSLRTFGYELGRFIYLMDAAMDYKKDLKKNNYNPLIKIRKKPEEIEGIMTVAIGKATEQFEKLPIVQDAQLLRNILYGGVWQHYYAMIHGKEKK